MLAVTISMAVHVKVFRQTDDSSSNRKGGEDAENEGPPTAIADRVTTSMILVPKSLHRHQNELWGFITARCTVVQSAVLRLHVVCQSVTLVDQEHIGWKSWKLLARTISPISSLFVAQRRALTPRGTWRKF